jgi:hypothetical protein
MVEGEPRDAIESARNRSRPRFARPLAEVIGLFEKLYRGLLTALQSDEAPLHRRLYTCRCGRPVYFQNSLCTACKAPLGYVPDSGDIARWSRPGARHLARQRRRELGHLPALCKF